jgi:hypothetical protein
VAPFLAPNFLDPSPSKYSIQLLKPTSHLGPRRTLIKYLLRYNSGFNMELLGPFMVLTPNVKWPLRTHDSKNDKIQTLNTSCEEAFLPAFSSFIFAPKWPPLRTLGDKVFFVHTCQHEDHTHQRMTPGLSSGQSAPSEWALNLAAGIVQ